MRHGDALEQVLTEPRQDDGVVPAAVQEYVRVHRGADWQREAHRIPVKLGARSETSADLGQRPPQRTQRVVRVVKELSGQLTTRRRALP